ncbi:MAG: helix-turn-helix transcriptional regulator [Kamptonema sp. SIO4C4]|nr:helix-turn-helix transcriptional regulator [Kamptonema sp. SIO4C4]
MKHLALQQTATRDSSPLSHQRQPWEIIRVQQIQSPPGEATCYYEEEHTLFLGLSPRPTRLLFQCDKTHTGWYGQGDMAITPAKTSLFARWESEDNYLQIRLKDRFLQSVMQETFEKDAKQLELVPEFQIRNSQIEAVGMMLFTELQGQSGNRLYVDSLAHVLAVNLLRHHALVKPKLPTYEGGLPPRQLRAVLDYIDTYLHQEIQLAQLAGLLDMSQFHFSRLFKQSLGLSPYQYLLQQRVERAKQLLKTTDRLIVDIALECGFNSHSHLSKQFRQFTGMTPKAYRTQVK